ncbi:MAG: biopolymer transporter ExbD [Deltaproteobacteria bacterium]|nr:biopolymer transporter ExbD [Deltaproteobacteria bacterium]
MALKFTDSNHERLISEINITPLTDVMLVLLVIFMVTTPLIMAQSIKVRLPGASAGAETQEGAAATVSIGSDGLYAVNGVPVPLTGISDRLKQEFMRTGSSSVIIRADMDARHSFVVQALDRARSAGASKLSIAAGKEKR